MREEFQPSRLQQRGFHSFRDPFRASSEQRPRFPELPPEDGEGLGTDQTSLQHSLISFLPFIATPGNEPLPFRDCGSRPRPAAAAVSPDGGSKWMAAEELGPL